MALFVAIAGPAGPLRRRLERRAGAAAPADRQAVGGRRGEVSRQAIGFSRRRRNGGGAEAPQWRLTPLGFVSVKGRFTRPAAFEAIRAGMKRSQPACKPGSVWRGPVARFARDGHSSGAGVAARLEQPTRATSRRRVEGRQAFRRPYSVLLPAGLAMPSALPSRRCALTAPFHPCRAEARRFAFCGAFPGVAPAGRYPAPCLRGARTFLCSRSGRPADWLCQG